MRAVVYRRFGPPEVLGLCEVDVPAPRDREVRIRVRATTVTAAECGMRRGEPLWGRAIIGFTGPRRRFRTLGIELAGEVDAVGKRVTRFREGDRIFGFAGFNPGANADYVCLPETASLAAMPTNRSFQDCAAAVDGASTALYFLADKAQLSSGKRVLIIGAAGSIGTYAVQLAKELGASVTGVCSSANVDLVKTLGADDVVDYTREDFSTRQALYDVVFDTVGKSSLSACKRCLAPGGVFLPTVITLGNVLQRFWTPLFGDQRVVGGMSVEKHAALAWIRERLEAHQLRVVIDRTYALEEIVEAHRHVDTGHKRGNVVISL